MSLNRISILHNFLKIFSKVLYIVSFMKTEII